MGWPNALTIVRIAFVPFLVYFAAREWPIGAFVVFALAALTDWIDGNIARRTGNVSRLGEFLDPLADKLLIGAALITLVWLRSFPLWAALVIAIREVAVSLHRSVAASRGRSIPASLSGKLKTAMQVPMVLLWLLPRGGALTVLQDAAIYAVVAITVFSGYRYFSRARASQPAST